VEFLTKSMLDTGEPSSVERSVAIVESLRKVAGGDLMHAAEHAVHLAQVVPRAGKAAVMRVSTPTMDVYAGMIPKIGVSADFVEIVPADRKLFILVGDMPGAGLKSAFVARFLANLFKRLVRLAPSASVTELMSMIAHTVLPVEYFDRVSMQCIEIDEEHERLHIANAGHPYPVLYSGRRKKSDRLAVRGSLFERDAEGFGSYAQRSAEIYPGDVLVLISDGLTEASRADNPYGYRFCQLLEDLAGQSARTVGEAILTSWRTHPRPLDWVDDTTVVVVVIRPPT
jgi:serine phosphatase RsbU (regulator of sigma subunit)